MTTALLCTLILRGLIDKNMFYYYQCTDNKTYVCFDENGHRMCPKALETSVLED